MGKISTKPSAVTNTEEMDNLEENHDECEVPKRNPEDKRFRIVLVGKSGNGKSATANTILGEKKLKSEPSSSPVTTECQKETVSFYDKELVVIDTPGFFATKITDMQLKREKTQKKRDREEQVKREMEDRLQREKEEMNEGIAQCISFAAPGPHVFLVVIQAARFTKEDQETVETIHMIFGKEAAHYTMALFTRGDDLEADGISIDDLVEKNEHLSDFLKQCHGGYHVFNNRDKDPSQVKELLQKISTMIETNGGRYYTSAMLREAERIIRDTQERIQKENPNMNHEKVRTLAEIYHKTIKSIVAVAGLGVTIGAGAGVGIECAIKGAAAGAIGGPVGAAAGAVVGIVVGTTAVVLVKRVSYKQNAYQKLD